MNTYYVVRFSRPAGLFSFGLLDGLSVRLRRPYLREAPAGFGLERLATAFMNNPGYQATLIIVIYLVTFVTMGSKTLPKGNPRIL
jgi:hypothetical protein